MTVGRVVFRVAPTYLVSPRRPRLDRDYVDLNAAVASDPHIERATGWIVALLPELPVGFVHGGIVRAIRQINSGLDHIFQRAAPSANTLSMARRQMRVSS